MDTDSFQKFPLSHLDFNNESPAEPQANAFNFRKSSSFETLLEQNEETLTRLKISLRKQSRLEEEIQKFQSEIQRLTELNQSLTDQNYVFRENDGDWKVQSSQYEQTLQTQQEKIVILTSQVERNQSELQRHQKYHEKIRNQVRPYLQQLKEYAHSLEEQLERAEKQHTQKELQVRELKAQMAELTKNTKIQVENMGRQHHESLDSYEHQIQTLNEELKSLKAEAESLVLKNFKLQRSFDRQVELENQLIELSRAKDLMKQQLESEVLRIQEKNNELYRENQKLSIEHADLKHRVLSDTERIKEFDKNQYDLQHQLESLRYVWHAKNEESEKLKIALQALEKLNLDLSLKIQELRSSSSPTMRASDEVNSTATA
ncbi:MAG: hypothetical protein AABY64_08695 [Bdellovibrionota bacterium]